MTADEFEALDVGDVIANRHGTWVISSVDTGGNKVAVQTRSIEEPSDWLAEQPGGARVMNGDDRRKLIAGDCVRLQGGPSYVIGVPLQERVHAAIAVCTWVLSGWSPEDIALVRKHR